MASILGRLFKQSPKKKVFIGIVLISIFMILTITKNVRQNFIKQESNLESLFAIYINDEKTTHFPSKEEEYSFDEEKSYCNNGVNINWSYLLWTANIDFTNYELQNKERTYCNLYFKTREEYTFDYTGSEQEFIVPKNGYYQVELWGASGGDATSYASQGGYVSGLIQFIKGTLFYIYVGESGATGLDGIGDSALGQGAPSTFNGGGQGGTAGGSSATPASNYHGGHSGGGASDIRLKNGFWQDFEGLKSRIMVAGAGGGNGPKKIIYDVAFGSNNFGLIGETGATINTNEFINKGGQGASQTSGYAFGYGGCGSNSGLSRACHGHSGGGGGYYGGFGAFDSGANCYVIGGGGGSSFISGHKGCNAIKEESTSDNIIHTGKPNHYSGYIFTDTKMIDGMGYAWTDTKQGLEAMPNPRGGYYDLGIGHTGNGYARITYLGK